MKLSTRKTMALGFSGAYILLTLICTYTGKNMPPEFSALVSLIVGFYFGGKTALDMPRGNEQENKDKVGA